MQTRWPRQTTEIQPIGWCVLQYRALIVKVIQSPCTIISAPCRCVDARFRLQPVLQSVVLIKTHTSHVYTPAPNPFPLPESSVQTSTTTPAGVSSSSLRSLLLSSPTFSCRDLVFLFPSVCSLFYCAIFCHFGPRKGGRNAISPLLHPLLWGRVAWPVCWAGEKGERRGQGEL